MDNFELSGRRLRVTFANSDQAAGGGGGGTGGTRQAGVHGREGGSGCGGAADGSGGGSRQLPLASPGGDLVVDLAAAAARAAMVASGISREDGRGNGDRGSLVSGEDATPAPTPVPAPAPAPANTGVFVSQIPRDVPLAQLLPLFEAFGAIRSYNVPNRSTGPCKLAFVHYRVRGMVGVLPLASACCARLPACRLRHRCWGPWVFLAPAEFPPPPHL
jgi:hypothetical protein